MAGRKRKIDLPFDLEIPWAPPSVNIWMNMNRWKRSDMKDIAYLAVVCAVAGAGVQGQEVPTPCDIHVTIQKSGHARQYDAQNYVTTVDKLFLDALTRARGRKRRGLGILPDDSIEYIRLFLPTVEWGHAKNRTILSFRPQPKGAGNEDHSHKSSTRSGARPNPQRKKAQAA